MLGDNRHDSVRIFGAIGPTRGVGATIIIPAVNTEAMNENLAEISTQVSQGAYCLSPATAPDGHQAGERLIIPDNITMLPLPPSAPEPNPMENVRVYWRGNKLSSLAYNSYDAMPEACKQAWPFLSRPSPNHFNRNKNMGLRQRLSQLV